MAHEERSLEFQTDLNREPREKKYKLLRVKGRGIGNLVLLGHEFLWHDLHYWRKRSVPHFKENCEPCEYHNPIRVRGYIAVAGKLETKVLILEVTDYCKDAIRELASDRTTLRGCIVNLSRLEKKDNGKLTLHSDGKTVDASLIPENIDVAQCLRRIWGMARAHEVSVPVDRTLILDKLRCSVQLPEANGKPS
jgi:hypothetical protein